MFDFTINANNQRDAQSLLSEALTSSTVTPLYKSMTSLNITDTPFSMLTIALF